MGITTLEPARSYLSYQVSAVTDLEPAHVEEELQQSEERHKQVDTVAVVVLCWVEKLTSKQTTSKERVHGQCCYLHSHHQRLSPSQH